MIFDEQALRRAAGNPNGKAKLVMPRISEIERLPDPKKSLYDLLRDASELSGRRLKKFSTVGSVKQIARLLDDFSPLRTLPAFAALEADIGRLVRANGWHR